MQRTPIPFLPTTHNDREARQRSRISVSPSRVPTQSMIRTKPGEDGQVPLPAISQRVAQNLFLEHGVHHVEYPLLRVFKVPMALELCTYIVGTIVPDGSGTLLSSQWDSESATL